MKYRLSKEEIEIENAAEEFIEFNEEEKNNLDTIINNTNVKKAITLRIKESDLERIKIEAAKEGIPYQTLITSILHKFTTHQLVDEKVFIKFKELLTQ